MTRRVCNNRGAGVLPERRVPGVDVARGLGQADWWKGRLTGSEREVRFSAKNVHQADPAGNAQGNRIDKMTIVLSDLDPKRVQVKTMFVDTPARYDVRVEVSDASPKIRGERTPSNGQAELFSAAAFNAFVFGSQEDAVRFANVLQRAIRLCGGKHLF